MARTERTCKLCGDTFLAENKEINRGNAKYCSLSCSAKVQTKNKKHVKNICIVCNVEFLSYSKHSKYCSGACKSKYYRLVTSEGTYSTKTFKRIFNNIPCEICNWNEGGRDLHHIIPVKDGGTNNINNLISVCPNHHRLIHEKKITTDELLSVVKNRDTIIYNGVYY
jgi:hypothetical protein